MAARRIGAAVQQGVDLQEVETSAWRASCRDALESGERFVGAYARAQGDRGGSGNAGGGIAWSALFARGADVRVIRTDAGAGVDSVVDLIPAADWDEREAHDGYGIEFRGHEPLRPLLNHDDDLERWTVPVHGEGVHQVAVGPTHAGVIESGHFRFHVVGERILALDPRLFYKHRGLQRAAEGALMADGLGYAQRACGACAVSNAVAFAQASELAQGFAATRPMRKARTVLLELERIYNHLHDIAAICAGVGFAAGNAEFAALKERALRLNAEIAGHRFLFGTISVGESDFELGDSEVQRARGILRELRADGAVAWRQLEFAASFQARLDGVGALALDDARRLGTVGPAARASGNRADTRAESPGLWYGSSFRGAAPREATGDVAARLQIRAIELEESFEVLDELLAEPLERAAVGPTRGGAAPLGVSRIESPRGETMCAVETDLGRVRRLHLRTASYANWPALAHVCAGELLPDFPLINKSFELCYACVDR